MKNIIFFISFLLVSLSLNAQIYRDNTESSAFTGVLKEYKDIRIPVPWAKVQLRGTDKTTYCDSRGFFALSVGSGYKGSGLETLIFTADGYETLEYPIEIGLVELGDIYMKPLLRDKNSLTVNDFMPAGTEDRSSLTPIGALATYWNREDELATAANFNLGLLGFKIRGYNWNRTEFSINGASLNDPETGYVNAALFGGLNDVTANKGSGSGKLINDDLFYGDLNGYSDIEITPLSMRRSYKASYSYGSGLFTNKVSASYASGETASGWGLFLAVSARNGTGIPEATKFRGMSYFFAAASPIDDQNMFTFFVAGAPTERGMRSFSPESKDAKYNPAWGYDGDSKRNSKINSFHQPVFGFKHVYDGDRAMWRNALSFSFGNASETGLNRTNTPYPALVNEQIDWKSMFDANDTTDKRSQFISEKEKSDRMLLTFTSVYDLFDWGNLATTIGVDAKVFNASYRGNVDDLLGGAYWLNVDKFNTADRPTDSLMYILNTTAPYIKAFNGSNIGHDYSMFQQNYRLWNMWKYFMGQFKFSLGGSGSFVSYRYKANISNGKTNIIGKQPSQNFVNYSAKAGAAYMLSKSINVELNAMYGSKAPLFRDLYIMPEISAQTVADVQNERIMAGELNFNLQGAFYSLRLSGFFTQLNNQTMCRSIFDNEAESKLNMILTGLGSRHMGGDFSAKLNIAKGFSATLAGSYGIYKYLETAQMTLMQQNNLKVLDVKDIDVSGLFVGSTPQNAFSLGLQYESQKSWWVGVNTNFAGNNHSDIVPFAYLNNEQQKLDGMFTIDMTGGYSYHFGTKRQKGVSISANVQNIADTKTKYLGAYTTGNGYKNDTLYAYAYGRTMFFILSFFF